MDDKLQKALTQSQKPPDPISKSVLTEEDLRKQIQNHPTLTGLKTEFERLSNFQHLMVLAVFLGFVTMMAEVGFLVCEAFWHKQESFSYLIDRFHQQDLIIQELQRVNANRKK